MLNITEFFLVAFIFKPNNKHLDLRLQIFAKESEVSHVRYSRTIYGQRLLNI